MKGLARRPPVQHLARPAIQQGLDLLDLAARDRGEVRALREELTDQTVRVLVRAALPRAVRMGEVDLDARRPCEQRVLGHLLATVVGEGPPQLLRQRVHLAGKGPAHRDRILRPQGHQERGPRRALHQRPEGRGVAAAHEQIAFPVAWHGARRDVRRPLLDTDHVGDDAPSVMGGAPLRPVRPPVAKAPQQLPLELAPWQDVQIRVDRLVGHTHRPIVRILTDQPLGNLFGRPALAQLGIDIRSEARVRRQCPQPPRLTGNGHGVPMGSRRPIRRGAHPGPTHFSRDRAGGSAKLPGHGSDRLPYRHGAADLLALGEGQSGVGVHSAQLLSPGSSQDTGVALGT